MGWDFKELMQSVLEVVALLLATVLTLSFKKIKKKIQERKASLFMHSINRNSRVQSLLSELRALTDADRIELFQIHNGEYFLSGESNMKCSLTHFYTRTGISIPEGNFQNIPTTHFPLLFQTLHDQSLCRYRVEEDADKIDPTLRQTFNYNGVRHALIVPLMRKQNAWMGFLTVTWVSDLSEGFPNDTEDLMTYAQQISDVLILSK